MKQLIIILMVCSMLLLTACSEPAQPDASTKTGSEIENTDTTPAPSSSELKKPEPAKENRISCDSFSDCPGDMDCSDEGFCIGPDCGECQYEEDFACYYYSCCSDEDCRDWETCIDHECYEEGEYPEETKKDIDQTKEPERLIEGKMAEEYTGDIAKCPDISCLKDNTKDCIASSTVHTVKIDFFDMQQTTTTYMKITPSNDKCLYYQETESMNVKFSDAKVQDMLSQGSTQEEIDEQETDANTQAQAVVGVTRECLFDNQDLYTVLGNWEQGDMSSSDFDTADCQ